MKIEKIDLYKEYNLSRDGAKGGNLTAILHENSEIINPNRKYPAILIIQGGGYAGLCDREADPIAIQFLAKGFCAFILEYSCQDKAKESLKEALYAVKYIKENSDQLNIEKDKVAVIGFSAGGHLAGNICVHGKNLPEILGADFPLENTKPDIGVLCYPVVAMTGEFAHQGSAFNLCGDDEELKDKFNIYKYVNCDSAPIYIWHTKEDELVPVQNTLMLAEAYNKNGVTIVMDIFEHGRHGQAIKDVLAWDRGMLSGLDEECEKWLEKSFAFLQENDFMIKA